jgi:hypothetical protein
VRGCPAATTCTLIPQGGRRLTHDWSAITGDVAKFGLGSCSMIYDVLIFIQHYGLYGP